MSHGLDVTRIVKRLLKRPVLALLRWIVADVESNWQRGQGPQ